MPSASVDPPSGTECCVLFIRTAVRHWPSAPPGDLTGRRPACIVKVLGLTLQHVHTALHAVPAPLVPRLKVAPAQPAVGVLTCSSKDEICHRYILRTSSRQLASKTSSSVTSWQDRAGYKRERQLSQSIRKGRTWVGTAHDTAAPSHSWSLTRCGVCTPCLL